MARDLKFSYRRGAENCESDYYYAKNYAVDDEEAETAASEEAHEEADDDAASDGADQNSEGHGDAHGFWNASGLDHVVEVFGDGSGDDGGGKEEGEAGGGGAVEVAEESGDHGDSAAGGAGDDGEDLGDSDGDGVEEGDVVDVFVVVACAFGDFHQQSDEDQHDPDDHGIAEGGFGLMFEQVAENGDG